MLTKSSSVGLLCLAARSLAEESITNPNPFLFPSSTNPFLYPSSEVTSFVSSITPAVWPTYSISISTTSSESLPTVVSYSSLLTGTSAHSALATDTSSSLSAPNFSTPPPGLVPSGLAYSIFPPASTSTSEDLGEPDFPPSSSGPATSSSEPVPTDTSSTASSAEALPTEPAPVPPTPPTLHNWSYPSLDSHRFCFPENSTICFSNTSHWFADPGVLTLVNNKIGTTSNSGPLDNFHLHPNSTSGPRPELAGNIPAVAPPNAKTRWTPQTRENFIGQVPYDDADFRIHGFQATHQPGIWMGEAGQMIVQPGIGPANPLFDARGCHFDKKNEKSTPFLYQVNMAANPIEGGSERMEVEGLGLFMPGGQAPIPDVVKEGANGRDRRKRNRVRDIPREQNLTAGGSSGAKPLRDRETDQPWWWAETITHIRTSITADLDTSMFQFDFLGGLEEGAPNDHRGPYIFFQTTRANYTGEMGIDPGKNEVWACNSQRQDFALGPWRAPGFKGCWVARFTQPFIGFGITRGDQVKEHEIHAIDKHLGGYVRFEQMKKIDLRIGMSFIGVEEARKNLFVGMPDGFDFDFNVNEAKETWKSRLQYVQIHDALDVNDPVHDPTATFWSALYRALQFPFAASEAQTRTWNSPQRHYEGYQDRVLDRTDPYLSFAHLPSISRAHVSLLSLFAPETVDHMLRTLFSIMSFSDQLPVNAHITETNLGIGAPAFTLMANAFSRGIGKDLHLYIQEYHPNIKTNVTSHSPEEDAAFLFFEREGYTPSAGRRPGMTTYSNETGYVANDRWALSAARTLEYAIADHATVATADIFANFENAPIKVNGTDVMRKRAQSYRHLWNNEKGFFRARNENGSWAGADHGWPSGSNRWTQAFNVPHDPMGLADLMGGREVLKLHLNQYFDGRYDHTDKTSHHVPYMYAAIGYPSKTQEAVRKIARENYNNTSSGLQGPEESGANSAWYVMSALGFYPLDPSSGKYVIGSPFFENMTIRYPRHTAVGIQGYTGHVLRITAPGAKTMPYVKGLRIDGKEWREALISHEMLLRAVRIEWEMASTPQHWGMWQ